MRSEKSRSRSHGVTLIELVVVMAIVGVLAAIAVPGYRAYLLRSHRAEAKSALLNLSAAQEKFYIQNDTYAAGSELTTAPPGGLGMQATTVGGYYDIAITAGDATGYAATATATGGQAEDTHCASFGLDEAGARDATNADCW